MGKHSINITMKKEILEQELKLADEMLVDAKLLFAQDRTRSAVSRAYYAIFHAAKAVLLKQNIKTKRHAATLSMFGSEVRQTSDYDVSESVIMEDESE